MFAKKVFIKTVNTFLQSQKKLCLVTSSEGCPVLEIKRNKFTNENSDRKCGVGEEAKRVCQTVCVCVCICMCVCMCAFVCGYVGGE